MGPDGVMASTHRPHGTGPLAPHPGQVATTNMHPTVERGYDRNIGWPGRVDAESNDRRMTPCE